MSDERWEKIEEVYESALAVEAGERAGHIAEACAGDEKLRLEIESLLAAREKGRRYFETPVFDEAIKLLADEQTARVENRRIGNYEVIREIGHGGMGEVYLATRADEYKKKVAIKIVRQDFDNQFVIARFLTERQILADLEHKNIARLLDGGTTENGAPYIVMEYIEGLPIDNYCDAHRLATAERLKLFRIVCSAVHYAHQNLVIHRDIKPTNILVTGDGTPKLLDFGIAKLLSLDPSTQTWEQTATAQRLMTPEYASPEQVRGATITTSSDVYSLGVLLYKLLTGHLPYRLKLDLPHEIERAICESEPEKPSTIITRIEEITTSDGRTLTITPEQVGDARNAHPEKLKRMLQGDLDNIILMAMRKAPERRYASVEHFSEDLRRHLAGLPVIARQDTLAYRSAKFIRRHKVGVAAAVLVLVTLIAGMVTTAWQARIATRQRAKADRVNVFLQEMIGFANPGWYSPRAQGQDVTLHEVLDDAASRVESELADQPEVRAEMQRNLGSAYLYQSRFDLAEHHLRAALETYTRLHGEDHQDVARTLLFLAQASAMRGNFAEAVPLHQRALAIYRKQQAGAVETRWQVANLTDLGLMMWAKGDSQAAQSYLREGLELASGLRGNDRAIIAIMQQYLAYAVVDLDEAVALLRASVNEFRALPGRERLELAGALNALGGWLIQKGQLAEAEAWLLEAEKQISKFPPSETHFYPSTNLSDQAYLFYLKGDYRLAEAKVNQALENQRKRSATEGHWGYGHAWTVLGLIMNKTGRSAEGEALLRQALENRTRAFSEAHYQTAFTKSALGECLTTQRRYDEAEPLLLDSYDSLKSSQGEQSPRAQPTLQRLVTLYEAWGKPTQAAHFRAKLAPPSP